MHISTTWSFDAGLLDYNATYENTLHYSPRFQEFARLLAVDLVARHDLVGATVGELGSGPGHFLTMLCEAGAARGYGWDPSYDPERFGAPDHAAVSISTDLFPADGSIPMRLAFSQHVLEHLDDPIAALVAQRSAVEAEGGVVYTEVPNGGLMIGHCALWDIIYEHLSYFVPTSLDLACRRAGLRVENTGSSFGDQFLWCEAAPGETRDRSDREVVRSAVDAARRFGDDARARIAQSRDELAKWVDDGPVALWGAGSKGMTYLNLVADVAEVDAVIDINPRKAGWGVPGTRLVVSEPDVLPDIQPRTVLVANPIYVDEVAAQLEELGVLARILPLWT